MQFIEGIQRLELPVSKITEKVWLLIPIFA